MARNRGGERDRPYGGGSRDNDGRCPSRFSDCPSPLLGRYSNNGSRDYGCHSPSNYRGGGQRAFVGPMGGEDVGGFMPVGGGGGGGFGPTMPLPPPPPMSRHKRSFLGRSGSLDRFDGGNFAKLFVGSVPRTTAERDRTKI